MTGSLAKRYARALAQTARDEGRLQPVLEELERTAAWLADPELDAALASPALAATARASLVAQITAALELTPLLKNFLGLLVDGKRLDLFPRIVAAYQHIVDEEVGRVRGRVRAPSEPPAASLDELRAALEKALGKQVLLTVELDPSLLGGLTVEIEGRIYDGSVRTQLHHLAHELARERSPG